MPIKTGSYVITNVYQHNPVFLENANDEEPIQGHFIPENDSDQTQAQWHWRVTDLNNGCHLIQNVEHNRYANCGSRAALNAHVKGASERQEWLIQETRCNGEYTIGTIDTPNFWMLPDKGKGTPVELFDRPNDRKCWWTFTNVETGAPLNGASANPAFLFELKPLPILPFSPLRLDFVIIQQMSEGSISNASMTIARVCGRLVSLKRVQCDAVFVSIIEVTSIGSDIFFERSYDVVTFENLRKPGGLGVSYKEYGGVSSLPDMAIRGLRPNTTKGVILNLNVPLLQRGAHAIIRLINRLAEHDITLILTPIQPTWEDTFLNSDVSKELKKLSCEYRRFTHEDKFSDYVINYNEMVALPRLSRSPELRNKIRLDIPHIIEVLKNKNHTVQSAAVTAFSQLVGYAELRDAILHTVPKIVDMLKSSSGDAEAAASALIKLSERVELCDTFRLAISDIVTVLTHEDYDMRSAAAAVLSKLANDAKLHDIVFRDIHKAMEIMSRARSDQGGIMFSTSTLLGLAAGCGYDALVHVLLGQKGVNIDAKDNLGRTPLSFAAQNGHDKVVRLLLAWKSVDFNSHNDIGQTPLLLAAKNGRDAVVRLLLAQEGVDVDPKDIYGLTPLSWAAKNGQDGVVRLLLAQEGVDANSKSNYGRKPLSWAAENGRDAGVRLLLEQEGAGVDSKNSDGRTPLSLAVENDQNGVVRLLLAQEGVEADSKDRDGRTPLSWAAQNGRDAIVRLLLAQQGVDADSKDYSGRTPLSWAAEYGRDAVVRLLLAQQGVDADSKDSSGQTALSWAAEKGWDAIVRLLLAQKGVDPKFRDSYGRTLSWDAEDDEDGVDTDSEDWEGETPPSLAAAKGNKAVLGLLPGPRRANSRLGAIFRVWQ